MSDKGSPYHSKGTWVLYNKNDRRITFEIAGLSLLRRHAILACISLFVVYIIVRPWTTVNSLFCQF